METKVKIVVRNGNTAIRYGYSTENFNTEDAKTFVFNTLNNIVEGQNKLKALGAKKNFFGLSEFKENYIDIDIVQEGEIKTITSGVTFKFSHLAKVENKKEAFDIIFDTHTQNNNVAGGYIDLE